MKKELEKTTIIHEVVEQPTPKEVYPKEVNISGTQKECDEKLRELRSLHNVEIIGISVSNNFVKYTLSLTKK